MRGAKQSLPRAKRGGGNLVKVGGGGVPLVRTSLLSTPSNGASDAGPVTPRLSAENCELCLKFVIVYHPIVIPCILLKLVVGVFCLFKLSKSF